MPSTSPKTNTTRAQLIEHEIAIASSSPAPIEMEVAVPIVTVAHKSMSTSTGIRTVCSPVINRAFGFELVYYQLLPSPIRVISLRNTVQGGRILKIAD